ncbi:MAG: type II toxin-antitoxin system Phd/YefM family antitoxin [Granulosicoccus sp.]
MKKITIRDLRNNGGRVIDQVLAGERLVVTRDGQAVAELCPTPRQPVESSALLQRWRNLPAIDGRALRDDIDSVIDQAL